MKKGFTLIELLVVIVIVGILGAISVSTYGGYIEKARIASILFLESQANRSLLAATVSDSVGPIGRWDLDEGSGNSAFDVYNGYSQNNNNFSNWWSSDTLNNNGSSFALNSNQSFRFNIDEPLQDEFSVSMRVKFDSMPRNRIFQFFCSSTERIQFQVNNSGNFILRDRDGSWSTIFSTPWDDFQPNKWYHILVSYSPEKAAMYLDGFLYHQVDNPPVIDGCLNDDVTRFYVFANNYTAKSVDNLKLWRKAFTAE